MAKQDVGRELVRGLIDEGITGAGKSVNRNGEKVRISKDTDGAVRFDLDGLAQAFVLKGKRIFERPYEPPAEVNPIQRQLGYQGLEEEVDTRVYRNRIVCSCGSVRWVKSSDLFQVKKCKPCTIRERKERRRVNRAAA